MIDKLSPQPSAKNFWTAFAAEQIDLHELIMTGDARAAYDRIGELLTEADYPYVYEITSRDDHSHLIFTPESDPELAVIVDAFVAAAPPFDDWRVFNRRQRRHFEDAIVMLRHVYEVDASDATFAVEQSPGGIDVVMHTQAAEILEEREKQGFVTFFLEHALGEALAMSIVRRKKILPPTDQPRLSPEEFVSAIVGQE